MSKDDSKYYPFVFSKEGYTHVVAIQEKSAGNDSVGDMWLESCTFPINTPIKEILKWAVASPNKGGKLIITIDQNTKEQ